MQDLAKRFIGKDCVISTVDSTIVGVIKEVTDGGIIVEEKNILTAINLDYVTKIKEYPMDKKGKRKAIIG